MRSIGLLKQNETPWPPFKTPQNQHSAYKDPRRVLLSKLFHAVVWHSLYRSTVHRDVSEHTLSLLIYLLDQALICYNNTSVVNNQTTSNQQQNSPMEYISENKSNYDKIWPKRQIKITDNSYSFTSESELEDFQNSTIMLLDSWYNHDDLVINLCTTITQIELPPPFFHYYFTSENTASTLAASTIANNIMDYFTTSTSAPHNIETSKTF